MFKQKVQFQQREQNIQFDTGGTKCEELDYLYSMYKKVQQSAV